MRTKILDILRINSPEPVSGEALSTQLKISRTAIWKHIQVLKKEGYAIEALPKKGYVLTSVPDKMLPAEIISKLKTKWLGRQVRYTESVTSTNEMGKTLANAGCANGVVCVAEEQIGGKGRLSRGWFSPAGDGLWFSVILKPPFMPDEASKCTLLAAVAVVSSINDYAKVKAAIKWPNDILLEGKKLVGILTEMSAEFGHINYIVIGIGINISVPRSKVPAELRDSAISLADVSKEKINRVELLAAVLKNLEDLYEIVLSEGFAPILKLWRQYSTTIGKEVKVIAPDMTYTGTAIDIDENGLLIVDRGNGVIEKVVAGDVSIRPAKAKRGKYE
ncbi:Bifunctional ligase/repressor BirA [bioreactor metagenome]|uniref:Bifunctional ligase/repressor BirA n=1 Tax=bioreactor metagenome TaxID=1076179 RepID=A0A644VRH5_9ZZZZ|nr:biotin--[acetyl-CoA-carboxylase] ligase [Acidaminococcaceae bacterium]NLU44071.1 biotin--[acetyl-CoA-carboxylase] ligase [Acholeplasmataceae bacterium]